MRKKGTTTKKSSAACRCRFVKEGVAIIWSLHFQE